MCPLPPNLLVPPHGDCLIWRGRITPTGYGVGTFPTGLKRAHQQAFAQSRGRRPSAHILHLCARPFCIQPSHLYEGTPRDNGEDARLVRGGNVSWSSYELKSRIATQVARYAWPSSVQATPTPLVQDPPVAHTCNDVLPAGDRRMCSICNSIEGMEAVNPPLQSCQTGQVDAVKRTVTDTDWGTVVTNVQYQLDRPRDRAERRRRMRNRITVPTLLSSGVMHLRDGAPFSRSESVPPGVTGPGIIALIARPRRIRTERPRPRTYGPRVRALLGISK